MFGLRYSGDVRSKYYQVYWRVEIEERDYVGECETMRLADNPSPIRITWDKGYDFWDVVKGSECTINILSDTTFQYMHMFTSDPRRFRVSVMRNNVLYWRGFVVADLYYETFAKQSEVALKAVDGFRLLSSEPFDRNESKISIHDVIQACVDKLELVMPISDWMDMTHADVPAQVSALRATYFDANLFGQVYEDATWRDAMDFCLKPFALQLFQSGGSVHVRRAVSLYKDERPLSFYKVGGDLGLGWLTTADGQTLTTAQGDKIGSKQTRDRIESMWNPDINVLDDSLVEIIPAIRSVEVEVENKRLDNLGVMIGLFNRSQWGNDDELWILFTKKEIHMEWGRRVLGVSNPSVPRLEPKIFEWWGPSIRETYNETTIKFNMRVLSDGKPFGGGESAYNFKWSARVTFDNGGIQWVGTDGNLYNEVQIIDGDKGAVETSVECKLSIKSVPKSGTLDILIRRENPSSGERQVVVLSDWEIKMSVDDKYDFNNKIKKHNNYANNVDQSISIPMSDIPSVPNAQYIYQLYFKNASDEPIRLWHDGKVSDTLANHIANTTLIYHGGKSRKITGPMFTKAHVDLNTVVQDDIYTKAGYYVDAIELDCLEDTYEVEMKEMPGLIPSEKPEEGEDCIKVYSYDNDVSECYKCGEGIITYHVDGSVRFYNIVNNQYKKIDVGTDIVSILESDRGVVISTNSKCFFIDDRGVIDNIIDINNIGYDNQGYVIGITELNDSMIRFTYRELLDYNLINCSYTAKSNNDNYCYYSMSLTDSLFCKNSTIVINGKLGTVKQSLIFDRRLGKGYNATSLRTLYNEQTMDINNYYYATLAGGEIKMWRRNGEADVTKAELIWMKPQQGLEPYNFAVLNNSQLFYGRVISAWIFDTATNTDRRVRMPSSDRNIVGAKYIGNKFYAITTKGIYKVL